MLGDVFTPLDIGIFFVAFAIVTGLPLTWSIVLVYWMLQIGACAFAALCSTLCFLRLHHNVSSVGLWVRLPCLNIMLATMRRLSTHCWVFRARCVMSVSSQC